MSGGRGDDLKFWREFGRPLVWGRVLSSGQSRGCQAAHYVVSLKPLSQIKTGS